MTELRVHPHLHQPSFDRSGDERDKLKGSRRKHTVWDARAPQRTATGHGRAVSWSARYANSLRLSDALVSVAVVATAYLWRFGATESQGATNVSGLGYVWICLAIVVLWNVDLEWCRSREKRIVGSGVAEYRQVVHATLRAFGIMAMILLVFQVGISRGFFAVALPLGIILLLVERWLWRRWLNNQRKGGKALANVVVLGTPPDVAHVIGHLNDHRASGYRVAGAALTTLEPQMELLPPWYEVPVLSSMADIAHVVSVTGAEAVVVAGALPGGPDAIRELGWRLEHMSTELVLASSLTNVAGPRVHFRPMEGLPLMHVELPHYSGGKHVIKRVMDIVLATAALLVFAPILLALTLIVKLDSPGPALFFQERVGRNGGTFKMVKFRSMVVDAEAKLDALKNQNQGAGLLFKMVHDPRVTRCGRWMRKFSFDELPQFWNVLTGEMSLVGPRPPLASEVAQYGETAHRRLLIKPGITGLWQVSGRSNLPWDEAVRLDLYYVENWSVAGDIVILWRTFKAVSTPDGAY